MLGIARYRLAELDAAAAAFARAAAIDPETPGLHWGQALLAVARNDLAGARDHGARAYAREGDARRALSLAQWAVVAGDYPSAARALDRYLALGRDVPQAAAVRQLQRFYRAIGRAPVNQIDARTTRAQLAFDLKPGDEIPYVAVRLNGAAPAYVLLDTGAERNVLDADYARSIGVGPVYPGGALHGAYRAIPAGQVLLDSLQLGSLTVRRVPFAVGDFAGLNLRAQGEYYLAGVINPALLLRDFLVVLDYGHRRLELVRYGAGGEAYAQRASRLRKTALPFAFDANGVWPVFEVSLDGGR
ncbi:MAG: aspartyl protease family protein, partial [Gemmatimonadota bacterium]